MNRRTFLRGTAGCAIGPSLAGCAESLSSDSAWRELVVDRPDGVYVPPKVDEMLSLGRTRDGRYGVAAMASRPHSFFTVAGSETTRVNRHSSASFHLMVSVWDAETETVVPSSVTTTLADPSTAADAVADERTLWPMLSQRMGFHYGDNVSLPEDGAYRLTIDVEGTVARRSRSIEGAFAERVTVEFDVEYSTAAIESLERTLRDEDRRGGPGALEMMGTGGGGAEGHDERDGRDAHPPPTVAPPIDSLPGTTIGAESIGDAELVVCLLEQASVAPDPTDATDATDATDPTSDNAETAPKTGVNAEAAANDEYVAVSLRSPYNRCVLPMASLSIERLRDGETVALASLRETIDPDLGHHYGAVIEANRTGDRFSIRLDAPPQASRHEGYETAFLETGDVAVALP